MTDDNHFPREITIRQTKNDEFVETDLSFDNVSRHTKAVGMLETAKMALHSDDDE